MTSFFYAVSIAFHTSVPALRKCMDTSRKKSFGGECSHSCTACCTSSTDLKDLPPIASWSGPKTWKSLTSTADVEDTRRTDFGLLQQNTCTQKSTSFGLDCRMQVILEEICICCTGHSIPPGHVVLQNYPSLIPKDSQHDLSRRWLCAEFFRFRWGGMAPFLAHFLGFWLVVIPRFHLQ